MEQWPQTYSDLEEDCWRKSYFQFLVPEHNAWTTKTQDDMDYSLICHPQVSK